MTTSADTMENDDAPVYEKTPAHRLLAGLSVGLAVMAALLVIFGLIVLFGVSGSATPTLIQVFQGSLAVMSLIGGVLVIPPAILGVYVAKHPKFINWAIAAAIIAYVLILCFIAFALTSTNAVIFSVVLYSVLLAIAPTIYLCAALGIRKANRKAF